MNGPEDDAGDTGADGAADVDLGLESSADGAAGAQDTDAGFDIDKSVDTISRGLALGQKKPPGEQRAPADGQQPGVQGQQQASEALAPPKSWAADKHELWKALPRPAQEYYNTREQQFLTGIEQYRGDAGFAKQLREVITPYQPMLRAQGISETDAVKFLLNANYRLTNGSEVERRAAYEQIGRDLGFLQAQSGQGGQSGEQQQVDPVLRQLQTELGQIKSVLTAEQRTRHEQARTKADTDVNTFAADKTNLYFDEVAKDMVGFINQGMDLKDAYDKAVWANPVTRAKEIARLKTEEAAKTPDPQKVEAARRAAAVNGRGSETHRAPTEHKGKFLSDESMKEDLRKIRARH